MVLRILFKSLALVISLSALLSLNCPLKNLYQHIVIPDCLLIGNFTAYAIRQEKFTGYSRHTDSTALNSIGDLDIR